MSKKKVSIRTNFMVEGLRLVSGEDFNLPANEIYTLTIDYPFSKPAKFPIKTGKGMGLMGVLAAIYKSYIKKYDQAEKDDDDNYWHGIGDLCIEGITVNHEKKTISLDVGS